MIKLLLSLAFTLTLCLNLNAFVYWTGGDGNWEDASNWSTGQIPGPNDDVRIYNGDVKLNSSATIHSLDISTGGILVIKNYARLTLLPTSSIRHALQVYGKLDILGTLQILDQLGGSSNSTTVSLYGYIQTENSGEVVVEGGSISIFDSGVYNNRGSLSIEGQLAFAISVWGNLYNRKTIDIVGTGINAGIKIYSTGHFVNNKNVFIENVHTGIENENTVYNSRNIYLTNCDRGIINTDLVRNLHIARIELREMNHSFAFFNTSTGEVQNYGLIRALYSTGANNFRNDGEVTNYSSGKFQLHGDSWYDVLRNFTGADFYNYGRIDIYPTGNNLRGGLRNEGDFTNYSDGEININGSFITGLNNFENFTNQGFCSVTNSSSLALSNEGILINSSCGEMVISRRLENQSSGVWLNESWLRLTGNDVPVNNGYFQNTGVIEDLNNTLNSVSINNDGVIARPLSGNISTGTNGNILEIGSLSQLGLPPAFYDSPNNGNKAGTYNVNNNTLDIYNTSAGLNAVYFEAELLGYNCTAWFQINIPGGIQQLQSPFPQSFGVPTTGTARLQVYPNPSNGIVNVSWPASTVEQSLLWTVHNLQGQQVARGDSQQSQLDLSSLPAATYILRTQDSNGQWQIAERIIIE